MQKIFSVFVFILINVSYSIAQERCGFDEYVIKHRQEVDAAEQNIRLALNNRSTNDSVRIIPVVVHVLHNGGTENISDAQIQSQIRILNEDFRKISGTNGDGVGVDTRIEFCLAGLNPEGKCTNGIVRVKTTLTNHKTYERSQLKELSFWDNKRYLNIYVVKSINNGGGTLGYSSFPQGPDNEDGIVVLHNAFGDMGTVSQSSSYNKGRTMTHEISHWFGLYHTFNGGCGADLCNDGDYICDTPPSANPNYGCPLNINSCNNDTPDIADYIANYTDYSDDDCKSMFTQGQADRMHATLNSIRTLISSPSNILSTGCDTSFTAGSCNVVADFTTPVTEICNGNSVVFTNRSLNNPLTFNWTFPGGTPSASTFENPTIKYTNPGTYDVTLITTNAVGSDTLILEDYITVTNPVSGQPLPYSENFESPLFPSNGLTISNPDFGITWERDITAVPFSGIGSVKINNLINTNYGQSDALILPEFDLTNLGYTPYLKFKWAYAKSDPNYSDELAVLLSKDCGVTFTQIFYRTGTALVTGITQTTPYVPDSNTIWKSASISLNNYITNNNVIIKIVNITDGGNNLYIDNINVGELTLGLNQLDAGDLQIYPNPFNDKVSIELASGSEGKVSVRAFSLTGTMLLELESSSGEETIEADLSELPCGAYYLLIESGKNRMAKKVIKIR